MSRRLAWGVVFLLLPALGACRARPAAPAAVRLVEVFRPAGVQGQAAAAPSPPPRAQWRFDGSAQGGAPKARTGWTATAAIEGLRIHEGRLVGRATTATPILHVERDSGGDPDLLQAVEVRLRVSAGHTMAVAFSGDEKPDVAKIGQQARDYPQEGSTPIVAGDELRTYSFRRPETFSSAEIRHLYLRPTDVAGATFEIESVRLLFRKEHLASVSSGVSWQGLSGIFRETVVSRSPETVRLETTLPPRPWLDLAVGTLDDGPVVFRVAITRPGATGSETPGTVLLERTITKPHRWEETPVDLAPFAGRRVTLALSLSSEHPGAIGLWGAPVVRSRGATRADGPQGVILIWADTLRRDHLDVYGYGRDTAPVLTRMAGEGTLFEDCLTQATWTKVSTPSLMTSLYPSSHGVRSWDDRMASSPTTLAEAYRDGGFATLSFASNNFTGQMTNLHQGFEQVFEDGSLPDRKSSKTSRYGMDVVLPWIEAHRDVPFFVFMSVLDPHDPYKPYPPYDSLWADPARAKHHERQTEQARKFITVPFLKQFGMPSREELVKAGIIPEGYVAHDRNWYDGSIRAMDAELGRLLERLRALGLERKTLVVFTGDHGEEFLEHGRMFHGQSAYGELNRVPLVLWGPGHVAAGARVKETVETIDLMPTLLAMSRLSPPPEMQGQSLLPLMTGTGQWASRPAITEQWAAKSDPPPLDTDSLAIVADGYKLIYNPRRHAPKPEYELFDYRNDPFDQTNIAEQHPDVVKRLYRELQAWQAKAKAARPKADAEAAKTMSGEELERLRALGYVQ